MDSGAKIKRERNPRENASLLSIFLFFFTFKTIRKGLTRDLKEGDVYETLNDYKSQKLGDKLESMWREELKNPNQYIMRPITKMFGLQYMIVWIPIFIIETSEVLLRPIFIGKVVSYFDPNTDITREEALWYSAALLLLNSTFTFCDPTYFLMLEQISMKIRIAVCSLLYKKCLQLNLNASRQFASGRIVTLITKDMSQFELGLQFVQSLFSGIIHVLFAGSLMYYEMGYSSLVGISILFVILPLQVYLGKKAAELRLKTLENTDQRVRVTQEILTAIRIIKMYTWEFFFSKSVNKLRKEEVTSLRHLYYLKAFALSLGQITASFSFYACVMAYVGFGNHITAEKAFVVIGCFESLTRLLTNYVPVGIALIAELRTSVKRITDFLRLEEVPLNENSSITNSSKAQVVIEDVTITTEQQLMVLENINIKITPGLTVVTGDVGSGKSTFLKLILGDVQKNEGSVTVAGKMSYASQEPWLFPATVRQNIIFGEAFDAERYDKIVQVCALKKDFDDFPQGDQTCLTDKGLNLSRGQKTRINLARAVYREADIYLLDDCLSAVDTHVGKHIFFECFKSFLKSKLCILVTHQNQFLREVDDVIVLNGGCVKFQGSYANFEKCSSELRIDLDQSKQTVYELDLDQNASADIRKNEQAENVYTEIQEEGAVNRKVYFELFMQHGGVWLLLPVLIIVGITQFTTSWSDYFVSFWVDMEQNMSGFRLNQTTNSPEYKELEEAHDTIMKQYSFVILTAVGFTFIRAFSFFFYFSQVSKKIHKNVFAKILKTGMLFFDKNLSGNVLNRFSRDFEIIDEKLPYVVFDVIKYTTQLVAVFFVVSSVNWYFIVPSIILAVLLLTARYYYLPTGRSIRRLEGATRSPVIGHINATLEGLTTIRASQAQNILKSEFDQHQDLYNSVYHMHLVTRRAFGLYLNITSGIYTAVILLTFLFIKTESLAGQVGLALTQSFSVSGILHFFVIQSAELENQMTSAERVLEYAKIEAEETAENNPEDWPRKGKICYDNVNLQYLPTSEKVLKDIQFSIESNDKVGVVGRTGAGKSSIIAALFKLYNFTGTITIDDVDIKNVETRFLRSKISIIPQDPVLFFGTIRSNLDPNYEYEDKELWAALEEVEMKTSVENLNSPITEGGCNFSIGQKQLICLARAVVRKNAILVLDEATANVDPKTDALIQNTIKKYFSNCTVLTIAHRLNTIMDSDKILVLESGMVVEFNSPEMLLNNKNGVFYSMVKNAGLLLAKE